MTQRKPIMTYLFLAINIAVYLYMLLRYGTTTDTQVLVEVGANYAPSIIIAGEKWRLLTAAFIHIGFSHLLMNMITLYFLGQDLELILGSVRFTIVYLISAIGGNLFSFAFRPNTVSAGASTALFGMFASYIALGKIYDNVPVLRQRAASYTVLLVINFLNGLFNPGIDNFGHLGGAVFGLLSTAVVGLPNYHRFDRKWRLGILAIMIALMFILYYLGQAGYRWKFGY